MKTPFQQVSEMNEAFGNPKGSPNAIDWGRVTAQCKNILDEYNELLEALESRDLTEVRDALCDIQVFAQGAQHLLGVDGDEDMESVITGVMTRFCKNQDELDSTIEYWTSKGIRVYTEGNFPRMIVKSAADQPDCPRGKFLKSTGYTNTIFKQYS